MQSHADHTELHVPFISSLPSFFVPPTPKFLESFTFQKQKSNKWFGVCRVLQKRMLYGQNIYSVFIYQKILILQNGMAHYNMGLAAKGTTGNIWETYNQSPA